MIFHDSGRNVVGGNNGKIWEHPEICAMIRGRIEVAPVDRSNLNMSMGRNDDSSTNALVAGIQNIERLPRAYMVNISPTPGRAGGSPYGRTFPDSRQDTSGPSDRGSQFLKGARSPQMADGAIETRKAGRKSPYSYRKSSLFVSTISDCLLDSKSEIIPVFCGFFLGELDLPRYCRHISLTYNYFTCDCSLQMGYSFDVATPRASRMPISPAFMDPMYGRIFFFRRGGLALPQTLQMKIVL